jgi:hypothetical protein
MTGWRQAVFIRQRRIDVIQRALSKILDEETWSPATPRRLHVGAADASSHGWTMIVPQLADFFLDHGGTGAPRLCRLADELRSPAYEVDVRPPDTTAVFEADGFGQLRISGSPRWLVTGAGKAIELRGLEATSAVRFGALPITDDMRARIGALSGPALADYLGALVGFPGWTQHGDAPFAAGALVYEPPHVSASGRGAAAGLRARSPETRGASVRTTPRAVPPSHDRRGTRPRSASRPRR